METQLTPDKIKAKQQLLQEYEPAQEAFAILEKNHGRLHASLVLLVLMDYPLTRQ